ncbi:hypothetical protein TrRE_jg8547 [Triparma retinervis]|uniref:Phospholipid scramblase n=1 Tax=Triparma retinervis TaxID=2557542 RepID=A0A9W6Z8Y9_9STRA|nr:hypothetical protein TrRE_jg8547 [Triparma retinervis]
MENFDAIAEKSLLAPGTITMERLEDIDVMVLSQATSQCCRCLCFQPSINFTMTEGKSNVSNYDEVRQEQLDEVGGWIAEEATLCGRTMSSCFPGGRSTKWGEKSDEFGGIDPASHGKVIFTHEKDRTNGVSCGLGDKRCPCCCNLPYLETKDANGTPIGRTQYVCDSCLCVPKFDVFDGMGRQTYRIRPDTCFGGLCVQCRCGGGGGKCFRVPFIIRDPVTHEPLKASGSKGGGEVKAQITSLWTGMKRCCQKKDSYAIHFPEGASREMKATLIGSNILIDMAIFEQEED